MKIHSDSQQHCISFIYTIILHFAYYTKQNARNIQSKNHERRQNRLHDVFANSNIEIEKYLQRKIFLNTRELCSLLSGISRTKKHETKLTGS